MKILLSGYYGFGNVGDEAVLQSIREGIAKYLPDAELDILTSSRKAILKIIKSIKNTDIFISGGGTLFQNKTSNRSFLYYIGLVGLALTLRKRVMIFAQGFGPLTGFINRHLIKFILNRVELITLRDQDSYDKIVALGIKRPKIELTADPAAILEIPDKKDSHKIPSPEGKKIVGIAIRPLKGKGSENLKLALAEGIDWLSKEYDFYPVFIPFHHPGDLELSSEVMKLMKEDSHLIARSCQPTEMLAIFSQFDLLIGMRLHSLIFAAMNKTPMLGISYDPKVKSFMKRIDQPYLEVAEGIDLKKIKNKLDDILNNYEDNKKEITSKQKELYKGAIDTFLLLKSLEA
jgi:polysaccharide pyruvyl transferase CsaB